MKFLPACPILLPLLLGAAPSTTPTTHPTIPTPHAKETPATKQADQETQARKIAALIAKINDNPNPFHADHTPATEALIDIGPAAIPATIPLLTSDDRQTQMCALSVLSNITGQMLGFKPGKGWPDNARELRWRQLWKELGDITWRSDPDERKRAVELWKKWVEEGMPIEQDHA